MNCILKYCSFCKLQLLCCVPSYVCELLLIVEVKPCLERLSNALYMTLSSSMMLLMFEWSATFSLMKLLMRDTMAGHWICWIWASC